MHSNKITTMETNANLGVTFYSRLSDIIVGQLKLLLLTCRRDPSNKHDVMILVEPRPINVRTCQKAKRANQKVEHSFKPLVSRVDIL